MWVAFPYLGNLENFIFDQQQWFRDLNDEAPISRFQSSERVCKSKRDRPIDWSTQGNDSSGITDSIFPETE
jgi:hypothetical protein